MQISWTHTYVTQHEKTHEIIQKSIYFFFNFCYIKAYEDTDSKVYLVQKNLNSVIIAERSEEVGY